MIGATQSSSTEAGGMKVKTVPALEARTQFGQIMKEVQRGQVRVLVEKSGVAMVGIISAQEFQQLIAEREARFEIVDRIRRGLPAVPDSEVRRDVRDALKRVRRRRA
jgi:prevent-host-death family protein